MASPIPFGAPAQTGLREPHAPDYTRRAMKPTPQLAARFAGVLDGYPEADRRSMFGCPCAWVNGQMCTGVHAGGWFVRLAEPTRKEALALPGAGPFAPTGVAMREYVVLPADVVDDDEQLAAWLERSLQYAATLPSKPQRPRRPRAPRA
jgi:TfoX/Sxy family transcriptional regulator of competence genes